MAKINRLEDENQRLRSASASTSADNVSWVLTMNVGCLNSVQGAAGQGLMMSANDTKERLLADNRQLSLKVHELELEIKLTNCRESYILLI